jgi:hypothetical protein
VLVCIGELIRTCGYTLACGRFPVGKSKSQYDSWGRLRMILIPGGRVEPTEVGGLHHRHTRSTPQSPLETLEDDPEKIIKKGKTSQEVLSIVVPGDLGNPQTSSFKTPLAASNFPITPFVGFSRSLSFGSFTI